MSYAFRELFSCKISGNSNERFLRKQLISTKRTSRNFWSNAHAWFYLGFMAKMKSMRKVLVNVFFAQKVKKKSPETRNSVI